jgi:hypothetical protein
MTIDLGNGVTFLADRKLGAVITRYPDGRESAATRELTPDNVAEVIDQGYAAGAEGSVEQAQSALWQSLVEHEILHTILARAVFCRESIVLRHESGAERQRYALRLHEEALVLSLQRYFNTSEPDPILFQLGGLLEPLRARLDDLTLLFGF